MTYVNDFDHKLLHGDPNKKVLISVTVLLSELNEVLPKLRKLAFRYHVKVLGKNDKEQRLHVVVDNQMQANDLVTQILNLGVRSCYIV